MTDTEKGQRVDPEDVRQQQQRGENVLLVCAYDDAAKCRDAPIEGALTLRQLETRVPSLGADAPLVFYCA
jgi:hypothetical protein